MYDTICEYYIKERGLQASVILKHHNYELTFECMMDLSKASDQKTENLDEIFMLKLKREYGIEKSFLEHQDVQWQGLTDALVVKGII